MNSFNMLAIVLGTQKNFFNKYISGFDRDPQQVMIKYKPDSSLLCWLVDKLVMMSLSFMFCRYRCEYFNARNHKILRLSNKSYIKYKFSLSFHKILHLSNKSYIKCKFSVSSLWQTVLAALYMMVWGHRWANAASNWPIVRPRITTEHWWNSNW